MKTTSMIKSIALTVGLMASYSSHAEFVDFVTNETKYATGFDEVIADTVSGNYIEKLTLDGAGGFEADAVATFGLFANDGRTLRGTALNTFYSIYAVFSSAGDVTAVSNGVEFTGSAGEFKLYMDVDNNTETQYSDMSLLNTADDFLLGMSTELGANIGAAITVGGKTTTSFNFDFSGFSLTADGEDYFIAPRPFSTKINVSGDFNNFDPTNTSGEQDPIYGEVSAQFYDVPEPSTLAVLALGLLGLGSARRKAK